MIDLDTSIPENDFGLWVRDLRDKTDPGWRIAHFRSAMTRKGPRTPVQFDGAGFSDLVLCHPARKLLLFRELKSGRGVVTDRQADWINDINAAGGDAAVWRPHDWRHIVDLISDGRAVA